MVRCIRGIFCLLVLTLVINAAAQAWVPDVGPGVCVGGCEIYTPPPTRIEREYWPTEPTQPRVVQPQLTPQQMRDQRAINFYNQGLYYWNLGKHLAAEAYFVKAFKLSPDAADGTMRKGYCAIKNGIGNDFFNQKNFQKALQYFQTAQSACPSDPMFQQNIDLANQWVRYEAETRGYQTYKAGQKKSIDRINSLVDGFKGPETRSSTPLAFEPVGDAMVVDLRDVPEKKADEPPKPIPQTKGVKFKDVPLPPGMLSTVEHLRKNDPFGGGPEGTSMTIDLVMDALQAGNGSLEDSLLYLQRRVREEGGNYHGIIALSYLEGLVGGAVGFKNSGPTEKQKQQGELMELLVGRYTIIPDAVTELQAQMEDTRDDAEARERDKLVIAALVQGQGDLYKSLQFLKNERLKHTFTPPSAVRWTDPMMDIAEDHVGWGAYYYILGLSAYPGLKGANAKGEAK